MLKKWQYKKLPEILKKGKTGIKIGPFGSQLKKEVLLSNGPYRVYGQENVYSDDFHIGKRYISVEKFCNLRNCELLPHDIVISTMGTIGKCSVVPENIQPGIMDSHLIRLRIDSTLDNSFFKYYIQSEQIQQQIKELSVGGIMDGLSTAIICQLNIAVPPLTEQRAIATALSDMDAYIEALEKLIAKKQLIKQGAMQELLTGKRRLPGFSGEWMEKQLGELLKYEQPQKYIVSDTEYFLKGIPVLTAGKTLILGYTNETYGIYDNLPVIIFDDFTTESKFINFRFKVKSSAMKLLTSTGVCDINLIFALMQMIEFCLKGHQRYWISEYSKIFVKFPCDISEQTAIAEVLSDMNAEIDALTAKLNKAKHIKQGMMSDLLTGRIRLTNIETDE